MEWSSEEKSFFSEGYVLTFSESLISRISVEDKPDAKYLAEVYVTQKSASFDIFKLHYRIFEKNEGELAPILYKGKAVIEICLDFDAGSKHIEFKTPEILIDGNDRFESMSMEPMPMLNGLTLMMATKVFLASVMRYFSSPFKNKTKKAINAD